MIRTKARIAGGLYLLSIAARIFADGVVRDRFIVPTDAALTASNILANLALFRWGFVADIISFASYIALTAYLYEVFRPVNRSLSLVAAYFSIVCCVSQAMSGVFHVAGMYAAGAPEFLSAFSTEQLHALALVLFRIRSITYHQVGLVFLGLYLMTIGYLVIRSKFMPWYIGALAACAGVAYMPFLSPPLAQSLLPNLLIPAGVGQFALTLWLLIAGVNEERWNAQNAEAATAG